VVEVPHRVAEREEAGVPPASRAGHER